VTPPSPHSRYPRTPNQAQSARSVPASPEGHAQPGQSTPSFGSLIARWDDPLTWSLSLFNWCGYRLGMHWMTAFWAVGQILIAFLLDRIGPQHVGLGVSWVLAVMLTRELTRLWVASRVGGEGEYVPLWPLGAMIGPTLPRAVGARILLVVTPSVVSAAMGLFLGALVVALGGASNLLFFNPFDPRVPARELSTVALQIVWWGYYANFVVAGLNLLPLLPLDGGRAIEALSHSRGRATSRRRVGLLGLLVAGMLIVVGLVADQMVLLVVGIFGGLTSWLELRRAEFMANPVASTPPTLTALPSAWLSDRDDPAEDHAHPELDPSEDPFSPPPNHAARLHPPTPRPPVESSSASTVESMHSTPVQASQDDLDRVLAKISRTGRNSLAEDELEILRRATERLQNE